MQIADAQREVRTVFMGTFVGSLVSSALWFAAAALSQWVSPGWGIRALVIGGMFIFPVTQLALKASGRRASLSAENPMGQLAMQVAFTIPLTLPVVAGATLHRLNWFFPACMVIVGAHYLPFCFLYGMMAFAWLAGLMIAGGVLIGIYASSTFTLAGWCTAAILFVFAFVAKSIAARDRA